MTVRVSYLEIYNETMYDLLGMMPGAEASGEAMQARHTARPVAMRVQQTHASFRQGDARNRSNDRHNAVKSKNRSARRSRFRLGAVVSRRVVVFCHSGCGR